MWSARFRAANALWIFLALTVIALRNKKIRDSRNVKITADGPISGRDQCYVARLSYPLYRCAISRYFFSLITPTSSLLMYQRPRATACTPNKDIHAALHMVSFGGNSEPMPRRTTPAASFAAKGLCKVTRAGSTLEPYCRLLPRLDAERHPTFRMSSSLLRWLFRENCSFAFRRTTSHLHRRRALFACAISAAQTAGPTTVAALSREKEKSRSPIRLERTIGKK